MSEIWRRLRVLFARDRFDAELSEEMAFHLEMDAEERQESGASAEEARLAARRQFGNATLLNDQSRDVWGWRWLDTLAQDVRFAARLMGRNRAFTAIAVVTLALGIGANTAVFSLLDAVLLRPLPYPQPDRLYLLWTVEGRTQRGHHSSYPDFREWQQQAHSFEGMAAFHGASFNVTGPPDAERVFGIACTPGLIEVLGILPALGRSMSASDGRRVAVITHRLWVERFGADRAAIGKPIRLDGEDHVVLGVLPGGFHFQPRLNSEPDVIVPMEPVPFRTSWFLRVVARLREGVPPQRAQAEMSGIAARIVHAHPELDRRQGVRVDPMHRYVVQDARTIGLLLAGAVAFLLLIACANVANLLLSRGIGRERELAIRVALGASRLRLVRQLLTESLLTALLGGLLGLELARVSLPVLAGMAPEWTSFLSRVQDNGVTLSPPVLAFTATICVVAAILFGTLPAVKCTRPVTSSAGRQHTSRASHTLLSVEIALSFVLLAAAGLMVNSLYRLLNTNPGFRADGLLTMSVALPEKQYATDESRTEYYDRALDRLRQVPGVESAAVVTSLPLTGDYSMNGFEIDGKSPRSGTACFQSISPDYFRAMGIPVLRGRGFTQGDCGRTSAVAVVNQAFARKYWPGGDAVGKTVVVSRTSAEHTADGLNLVNRPRTVEIIGVAGDVSQLGLDAPSQPEIFMPHSQRAGDSMTVVLRAADGVPAVSLAPAARAELRRLDLDLPITDVRTMGDWIGRLTAPSRFVFALIGVFAVVAVTLAAFGIYGVVSHSVACRTHEIAVRLALGARRESVVAHVTRQHLWWVLAGVAAGVAGAAIVTRLLTRYLYGVRPSDPPTYALAAVVLLLVALAADIVPAARVARIDPSAVLKSE
jgi:putative ABC transport system permease protein